MDRYGKFDWRDSSVITSDSFASSRNVLHLDEASCAAIVIFITGLCDSEDTAYEQYGRNSQPPCFQWKNIVPSGCVCGFFWLLLEVKIRVHQTDLDMVKLKSGTLMGKHGTSTDGTGPLRQTGQRGGVAYSDKEPLPARN